MRVGVVVLGDLGRSPRMTYHALSLASHQHQVDFIGYAGSELAAEVTGNEQIRLRHLGQPAGLLPASLPRLLNYVLKTVLQSICLLFALPWLSKLDCILVQTPPGIPTLPVLWLYCFIKGTRLVIDFHNYSHTILALAAGPTHPLVRLSHWLERLCGRRADAAFCVSRAMAADLAANWGIPATVLHDRPPKQFGPISVEEKHDLLVRLGEVYEPLSGGEAGSSVFTEMDEHGHVSLRDDRPGLVVSSTSWTEDEDFSILLDALVQYNSRVTEAGLPKLICIITGKGNLKDFYLAKIKALALNHIDFITPWLQPEDYPRLLAAADIGISLHTSSSGLDLPMKVVDMFGCGTPVLAKNYPAIDELVLPATNGDLFETADQLSQQIQNWFEGFTDSAACVNRHKQFRDNLAAFRQDSWTKNWDSTALPLLTSLRRSQESSTFGIVVFFVLFFLVLTSYLPTVR